MTAELEDELRRVIERGSGLAPRAPRGLGAQVAARSRRRRTRAHALVAAAAVMLVAGGVGASVRLVGGDPQPATPPLPAPTASATTTAQAIPDPLEQVWPDAVWTMPAKLPGGRAFQPRIFLDDRTILLETWSSFEKADGVYAYDLETGDTRKITTIRTPKGVFASYYATDGKRLFWQTIESKGTRFWSVPLSGGRPSPVGPLVKGGSDELAVDGDKLAWSVSDGGVFTMPLTGGPPTPVPGAERLHILRWPWAGTPGDYTPDNETSFAELLNTETGEKSVALVRPGERNVRCGVTHCVGMVGRAWFYRLRDGSQERPLEQSAGLGLAFDRFTTIMLADMQGQALVDLFTGRSADLGLRFQEKGSHVSIQPGIVRGRLIGYELNGRYVIIDLARIR
ncbi:hypothetical protein OIE66_21995 [Nonomuraea sp. NBC_01738]|uniref:TolB family protein n=1 Tax=Nonomuraea sp. NBC_01738 TaxID=2976003 RepID=UPI002E133AB5|nr:hypothetical protein OIE66_21995 [Nonomuraea sp. NBC_01738]